MRFRPRLDANQTKVVDYFRTKGIFVQSLASLGGGVPDILVAKHGKILLIEIKDGEKSKSKQRLTELEYTWAAKAKLWGGLEVRIVKSLECCDKIIEELSTVQAG